MHANSRRQPLQNFGEHGRELISSEIALRLLRLLCSSEAERGTFLDGWGLRRDHVQALLQRAVFKVRGNMSVRCSCTWRCEAAAA